jgi:hypothetical protein
MRSSYQHTFFAEVLMKTWRTFWFVAVAAIALLMPACGGGGGGGGGGEDITIADEAYTGVRTQAEIDAVNAEALVLGAYAYGDFGGIIPLAASPAANGSISEKISDPFKLATLFKQTASLVKQDLKINTQSLLPPNELCINYPAGYTSDTLEQSDSGSTVTVKGDIIYTNCDTGEGFIVNGTTNLSMTLNLNTFLITKFAMTMNPIQADDGSMAFALYGRISGSEDYDNSGFLVTHFNFEITLDDLAGHTYWLNNNKMDDTEESFGIRSTSSGRYYDNDYGYVDFTTAVPIFVPYNSSEATYDGRIEYTGSNGSQATLSLGPNESDYCINGSNTTEDFSFGTCVP